VSMVFSLAANIIEFLPGRKMKELQLKNTTRQNTTT